MPVLNIYPVVYIWFEYMTNEELAYSVVYPIDDHSAVFYVFMLNMTVISDFLKITFKDIQITLKASEWMVKEHEKVNLDGSEVFKRTIQK